MGNLWLRTTCLFSTFEVKTKGIVLRWFLLSVGSLSGRIKIFCFSTLFCTSLPHIFLLFLIFFCSLLSSFHIHRSRCNVIMCPFVCDLSWIFLQLSKNTSVEFFLLFFFILLISWLYFTCSLLTTFPCVFSHEKCMWRQN